MRMAPIPQANEQADPSYRQVFWLDRDQGFNFIICNES
jgi:hypothetical protein